MCTDKPDEGSGRSGHGTDRPENTTVLVAHGERQSRQLAADEGRPHRPARQVAALIDPQARPSAHHSVHRPVRIGHAPTLSSKRPGDVEGAARQRKPTVLRADLTECGCLTPRAQSPFSGMRRSRYGQRVTEPDEVPLRRASTTSDVLSQATTRIPPQRRVRPGAEHHNTFRHRWRFLL